MVGKKIRTCLRKKLTFEIPAGALRKSRCGIEFPFNLFDLQTSQLAQLNFNKAGLGLAGLWALPPGT